MGNVKFYSGTKVQYLNLSTHNPAALYFCDDTGELFKGDILLTDGVRIVPTKADLPECSCAAEGVVYYIADTKSGFMLSPTRDNWLQTIYAPVTDVTTIPEGEEYNVVTTVGAVRDIENAIYAYIDANLGDSSISNLVPVDGTIVINDTEDGGKAIGVAISTDEGNSLVAVEGGLFVPKVSAGDGIEIVDNKVGIKLADAAHGLVSVDGTLTLNLATKSSDGAMSKEDKLIIDSIPYAYVARKYDISGTPVGTLVDYRDHEIRIMCPADAEFVKQEVGANGNANMYYMTFKAYAPEGAVSFKEGDRGIIINEMFTFDGPASGIDEFGRRYSVCWLALAMYDEATDTWTYFGKNSTESKYIGWDYVVEWYDENGVKIGYDSVRINLSNEDCHNNIKPYYVANYATAEDVAAIKESVSSVSESYTWGEM